MIPLRFSVSACRSDEKDASKQIASVGQGGLSLPDRDYYISDAKRFRPFANNIANT